ncbi:MAG: prepilin-type N-terminal cleavage/methylation domain-containing protein [Gammaproteobacteria bacterium]|nr:prepilin-type N-terminal cleavage/methylation domain-containing protein [Gammaproteobacteria bacterium]
MRTDVGFSLTELLVTLAILALLAAAATPLWIKQLERARRLDATHALVRVAVLQERFYFENGRYARGVELASPPPAGLGVAGTERGYYQLRLRAPEGALSNGFAVEAIAVPEGPQAGDEQCRVLSVDSTGRRASENAVGGESTDACWP